MGENFLSTKFISTLVVIVMAYALVFAGKLDAKDWMDMATVAVGIFTAGNVVQKFVKQP
jgi:hypothetical protein